MVGRRTSDAGVDTRGMIDLAFDDGDEGDETAVDVFEGEAGGRSSTGAPLTSVAAGESTGGLDSLSVSVSDDAPPLPSKREHQQGKERQGQEGEQQQQQEQEQPQQQEQAQQEREREQEQQPEVASSVGCSKSRRWPFSRLRSSRRKAEAADGFDTLDSLVSSSSPSSSGNQQQQQQQQQQQHKSSSMKRSLSPKTIKRLSTRRRTRGVRASCHRVLCATQLQRPMDHIHTAHTQTTGLAGPDSGVGQAQAPRDELDTGKGHLFVCVHGLEGNRYDLRTIQLRLRAWAPQAAFVMWDGADTHRGIPAMAESLIEDIQAGILKHKPTHISFVGHSMGNLVIRYALSKPDLEDFIQFEQEQEQEQQEQQEQQQEGRKFKAKAVLYSYVSLCGPHCGAVQLSGLVSTGLWFMGKLTRSASIPQLQLKDGGRDPRTALLYSMRHTGRLGSFRHVVLVASPQDGYVSVSSALLTPQASSTAGEGTWRGLGRKRSRKTNAFEEIRVALLNELLSGPHTSLTRCQVVFPPSKARFSIANAIGRTAHVALLDSERFVAKFVLSHLHCFLRPPSPSSVSHA